MHRAIDKQIDGTNYIHVVHVPSTFICRFIQFQVGTSFCTVKNILLKRNIETFLKQRHTNVYTCFPPIGTRAFIWIRAHVWVFIKTYIVTYLWHAWSYNQRHTPQWYIKVSINTLNYSYYRCSIHPRAVTFAHVLQRNKLIAGWGSRCFMLTLGCSKLAHTSWKPIKMILVSAKPEHHYIHVIS